VKNEKRREKRREASGKGWDESDDELGDLKGEFERLDVANGSAPVDEEGGGLGEGPSEMEFPPLSNGEGSNAAPPTSATTSPTALEEQAAPSTEILTPPPSSAEVPETAAEQRSTPTTESPSRSSPSKPQPAALPSKPHPIQGGRNGPVGLANPPPPASQKKNARSRLPSKPTPTPPPAPEPRVRKEVRVREGGANELSSLAARVKNLVVENQKNGSVRDRKGPSEKA
jgi:hypothetical protein